MKRKSIVVLLVFFLILFLTACSSSNDTSQDTESSSNQTSESTESSENSQSGEATDQNSKAAVIYFSKTGNTEKIAKMISDSTGAEMIKIEPVNPYPDDYDQTVEQAQKEQDENARPEITTSVTDFSQYDKIFLGVPVWWNDLPMPVYTFLDKYDFSGKTVGVFTTHHGSGLGKCVESVQAEEPNANIVEGLDVYDEELDQSQAEVTDWAKSVMDAPQS